MLPTQVPSGIETGTGDASQISCGGVADSKAPLRTGKFANLLKVVQPMLD